MKEDIDIDEELKISCPGEIEIMKLKTDIDSLGISPDTLMLSPDSREVAVNIAGYADKKGGEKFWKVCQKGQVDIVPLSSQ